MNSNPQSLRILHLNSLLTGGGTDDQCVKLAGQLHRLGQHVFIAGPSGRRFAPVIAELGTPFFDTGPKANQLQFILRTAQFIRREKFQIVHGHHGRDLWPAVIAVRLAGTKPKLVLTRHMAKSPSSWASRHFLLGQCDAMIAVSEFTAKVLREGAYEPQSPEAERHVRPPLQGDHSKIQVIPGGIDTGKFRQMDAKEKRRELGLQPGDYAFAVVGGFDLPRGKGQREFLAAAARLHEKIPHARFLIIGRGSMDELLKSDIARLGLTGKAWLTGQISDMPQVMSAVDCLVHPQIGTEALGLVVCEAHACGKPVIASALDGIPEAFAAANYGKLVPEEDIAALADAMIRQSREPGLTPAQAAEMHRKVEQTFSLEMMGARVLRFYRDLLGADSRL
jgi:glycosyltransferase involved in cell wall biosynthesis